MLLNNIPVNLTGRLPSGKLYIQDIATLPLEGSNTNWGMKEVAIYLQRQIKELDVNENDELSELFKERKKESKHLRSLKIAYEAVKRLIKVRIEMENSKRTK